MVTTKVTREYAPEQRLPASWLFGAQLSALFILWFFVAVLDKLVTNEYTLCSNNIYTVDDANPHVECIFVRGTIIHDMGSFEDIERRREVQAPSYSGILEWILRTVRRKPKIIHLEPDSIVVPGLADAHAHIIEYGFMVQLPLATTTSVQGVVDRIKHYILAHPDIRDDKTKWISGMGWDQTKWSGTQFPTALDLDQDPLLKDRPICLTRVDGHARWVSPRVLELMGDIPAEVEGGLIVRDKQGSPTGVFVDNAMELIPIPDWSENDRAKFFDTTMKDALSVGLTSIHDADSSPEQIAFFKKRAEEGKLPNRLYIMGNGNSQPSQIPYLINHGKHGRLTVRSVKLFTDGALGSWGAALLAPYSDHPETSGLMLTSPGEMSKLIHQWWRNGFQVNVHCIGDRANHVVLDIFEEILDRENGSVTEWRPRIEHAQIFTQEDLLKMGRLGVIASVQPTHATSDMSYAESRLGPERIKGAYAYQTLLRVSPNNVLPLGSDFPVESINPLLGFYAAVSRLYKEGSSPHGERGWFPEQHLTRAQALKGMTLDAAYASFAENTLGSLTPGKKADFVVLDRDIMTVPLSDILETKVRATVIDGEVLYGSL